MISDIAKVMAKKTDRELATIVTNDRSRYNEEALTAAKAEIQQRGIDIRNLPSIQFDDTIDEAIISDNQLVRSAFRFVHLILDTIVVFFLNSAISIAIVFINGKGITETNFIILFLGCLLVTFIFYYTWSEYKFQRTFGKLITGTIVVTYTGQEPALGDALRRAFLRLIPFDGLSFLFSRNGFHDKYSDTRVVFGKPQKQGETEVDVLHD